ncbi:Uteroglobin [Manis pentadactyla]|nr:Uteroglobin [Manis pentadactyla]
MFWSKDREFDFVHKICQSFLNIMKNFFMGTLANYEAPIEPFNPDVGMKDAGILLKKLVDPRRARTAPWR